MGVHLRSLFESVSTGGLCFAPVSQSSQSAAFTGWGTLRREDCGAGMTSLLLGVVGRGEI